jgi:hypothetical protein
MQLTSRLWRFLRRTVGRYIWIQTHRGNSAPILLTRQEEGDEPLPAPYLLLEPAAFWRRLLGLLRWHSEPPPPDPEVDEYGLPRAWRHETVNHMLLEHETGHWPIFERWCQKQGRQAFPASVETVLRFLTNPPVSGPELYRTWRSIDAYHEAHYWHTDANPVFFLKVGAGVRIEPNGYVEFPPIAKRALREHYDF